MNILAFMLGWPEIVLIMVVILLLFGGKKLPELAKGVAKGLKSFRREMDGVKGHINDAIESTENTDSEAKTETSENKENQADDTGGPGSST